MSDWIDEEAEKTAQAKTQKEQSDYLINYSNYWAILFKQIESDVEKINSKSVWKEQTGNQPVTVKQIATGYEILKPTFPYVSVIVINQGKFVEIQTVTKKDWQSDYKTDVKKLDVESDGGARLYLKLYKEAFFIPEQASQYILSPVIEALNNNQ